MRYYDLLAEFERDGFDIVVDKSYEDLAVRDCFDESCYDVRDIERKIDSGHYEWFMLRVRVLVEGLELGNHYLGGCLYENPKDVLSDGTAEDCIAEALHEARARVYPLYKRFAVLNEAIEQEGVTV